MEGGANTFSGALTVVAGEVQARANKAISDLTILTGATFSQTADLALNQSADKTTALWGTLDLNVRSLSDANALSANLGVLSGGASGVLTATATGAVQTVNINSSSNDSSFAGVISGRVALVKNGAGTTLTLSGVNTQTEATTVNAGRLTVNGSLPAASSVAINSSGALGGSGVVNGPVILANGAHIAPGHSVGTLTTGAETWHGGAVLAIEMNTPTGSAGSDWDLLAINGALTLDASITAGTPFQIQLSGPPMAFNNQQSNSWLIVTTTSVAGGFAPNKFSVDASAFATNNPLAGGQFSVAQSGNNLYLNYTPLLYTPLELWRFANFGNYSNTGAGADDCDFEGDGRANLIEYATGSDPKAFDAASVLTAGKTGDGTKLTVTFNRIADPVLIYALEAQANLSAPPGLEIWSSTGVSNTTGPVTVPDAESISEHKLRFLRLRVGY